jgi:CubicO group peptidase (beta-lactamase class C family)
MRLLLTIIAAAICLAAGGAHAAPSARDNTAIAAVETRLLTVTPGAPREVVLAARMAELKVPGVSIAVFENGRLTWARAYGKADAADGGLVTQDTLFQAASMSKALAAAGRLRLVEQGRLDLDQDVNARLRAWQVPLSPFTASEKVTLRRLLSHTAGLTVSGFPGYQPGKPVPTAVQILEGQPPSNTPAMRSFEPPGQGFAYSGGGYTVAQLLMTEASGKPYPDLLDELVLRPAGMRRSTFAQPLAGRLARNSASGHGTRGDVIPGASNTYPEYAAASLWTTPSDYGRFMIALQNAYSGRKPAFLRQSSAKAMMTPILGDYGLGEVLGRRGGRQTFEHGGGNRGFQCNSFAFLDGSRQGVVIMTNSDTGGVLAAEILRTLSEAYRWGEAAPPSGPFRRAPYVPTPPK